ncbi:hypothetical protein VMCG_06009 [Cytospora schulzeri]|uniref:NADH dehydrogenase [ubiquinone] 1 alpha subcomplex subunit 13 n=1 Tax=Cytospora schulzeri TaxID=448051 RepID=A0A423WGM3_9PEZI|nr:hypothetical protein VMCG_06009 [Valsa malicola]
MPQDMPPVGGYDPVQYKEGEESKVASLSMPTGRDRLTRRRLPPRPTMTTTGFDMGRVNYDYYSGHEDEQHGARNLPARGFKPATLLAIGGAVMIYGWYSFGKGAREQRELAREKMWSRIHLIPALQAEEDRDQVRRYLADQARERELMGGENFKVYNSDRFVKPTFSITPEKTK